MMFDYWSTYESHPPDITTSPKGLHGFCSVFSIGGRGYFQRPCSMANSLMTAGYSGELPQKTWEISLVLRRVNMNQWDLPWFTMNQWDLP